MYVTEIVYVWPALKPLGSREKLKVESVPNGVLIVSSVPDVYIVEGSAGIGLHSTMFVSEPFACCPVFLFMGWE